MKDMNDQEFLAEVRRILMMGGTETGLHKRLWDTARGWAGWSDGILPRTGVVVGGGGAGHGSISPTVSHGTGGSGPPRDFSGLGQPLVTDAATIKAERDELREALSELLNVVDSMRCGSGGMSDEVFKKQDKAINTARTLLWLVKS